MRQNVPTTNWAAGELSPDFHGRPDSDVYRAGAKLIQNWLPTEAGSLRVRGQANVIPNFQPGNVNPWLIPYYVGALNVRIFPFRHSFKGDLCVVLRQANDFYVLDLLGMLGLSQDVTDFSFGSIVIPKNNLAKHISEIDVDAVQVGDSLFIVGEDFNPVRVFFDTDAEDYFAETIVFFFQLIGTVALTKGSNVVTGTDTKFVSQGLQANRIVHIAGNDYRVNTIGVAPAGETSLTIKNVDGTPFTWPNEDVSGLTFDASFGVSAAANFFPSIVTFHEGRLVLTGFGNTTQLLMSRVNDPFVVRPAEIYVGGTPSDAPIEVEVLTDAGTEFRWAASAQRLILGTSTAEYASTASPVTPTNIGFAKQGTTGCSTVRPAIRGGRVVFPSADSSKIAMLDFDLVSGQFNTVDLSAFARHLIPGIKRLAFRVAQQNDGIERIVAVKNDGTVVLMSQGAGSDIPSWSRVSISPLPVLDGDPAAVVDNESVFVEDVIELNRRLYLLVRREGISGNPDTANLMTFLELNAPGSSGISGYALDFLQDCEFVENTGNTSAWKIPYLATDTIPPAPSSETDTILAGKRVFAVVRKNETDGFYSHGYVDIVDIGVFSVIFGFVLPFTMTVAAERAVFVGIPVTADVDLLEPLASDGEGYMMNRKRRIVSARVGFQNMRQFQINQTPALNPQTPNPVVEQPSLSGAARHAMLGWKTQHDLRISNTPPYGGTLLNVNWEVGMK